MTGTASDFIDYNETNSFNPINFELFSVGLFGNIDADSVLNEITIYGCSVHIPKGISTPTDIFNLLIMSPDDDKKLYVAVNAQIRWIDTLSSAEHDIAGIKFIDLEPDIREETNVLMQHQITNKQSRIKCRLLKK